MCGGDDNLTTKKVGPAFEERGLLETHLTALRRVEFLKYATIIYIPELALGKSGGYLYDMIRDKYNVVAVFEKKGTNGAIVQDPGIRTQNGNKVQFADYTRDQIMSGSLKIARDFVVSNPYLRDNSGRPMNPEQRFEHTWTSFIRQMRAYRTIQLHPDNPMGAVQTTVSGKVDKYDKVNKSMNDDIMVAFTYNMQMCGFYLRRELPNFDYESIKRK